MANTSKETEVDQPVAPEIKDKVAKEPKNTDKTAVQDFTEKAAKEEKSFNATKRLSVTVTENIGDYVVGRAYTMGEFLFESLSAKYPGKFVKGSEDDPYSEMRKKATEIKK
ncbi:hypothetical protein U9K52_08520 [Chryseobacterium sp. MHB01]|uniref:hypothetical protein n=1 Tax=Chryseobacterium sp. MHB01 TaxID=3109433 RepID=UPI002AFDF523|nr:hypothetical protein [Chryseobacterium sp. MHB01]MEA1848952.1 hypothetical protein [Chryseobacterium sp. MHB01]